MSLEEDLFGQKIAKQPVTKSDVRSYLGLTGYYIRDYAGHSVTLTAATRKTAPATVEWSQQLEDEFQYLKQALCSIPSLTIPTQQDSFLLQTDASAVGIGAVLSVKRDNMEKPVAFYSRKLLPTIFCYRSRGFGYCGRCRPLRSVSHWKTVYHRDRPQSTGVSQLMEGYNWSLGSLGSTSAALHLQSGASRRFQERQCRWTISASLGRSQYYNHTMMASGLSKKRGVLCQTPNI